MDSVITLNVGGVLYTTTTSTLCRWPESMLGALVRGSMDTTRDADGRCFIDRDGRLFEVVLNFLRSNRLSVPSDFRQWDNLEAEADFYQIRPLIEAIQERKSRPPDQHCGRFLEIIEVRTGSTATMPTNNSRVKTILSGRKDVIMTLPILPTLSDSQREKLQCFGDTEYPEVELVGSNIRLRLGEYLKASGWLMVDSSLSTSSAYDKKSCVSQLIIEQSFRDRWYIQLAPATNGTVLF